MLFVLIIVFLMIVVFYVLISHVDNTSINNIKTDDTSTINYASKKFLSNNEYNFLTKIIDLETELHVNIVPQVNLASVIEKVSTSRVNTELFRNIDFGIFNADYSKLLLLIELNYESHDNSHKKERDIKFHDICDKAGIKLITFYTKYSNEKEDVKSRIIKELNISPNND